MACKDTINLKLNRIISILEDLSDDMKPAVIGKTAEYQNTPTIQRLGFLFDLLNRKKLVDSLYNVVKNKKMIEIPLSLSHKTRKCKLDERWKLIVNSEPEVE